MLCINDLGEVPATAGRTTRSLPGVKEPLSHSDCVCVCVCVSKVLICNQ